MRKIRIFTVVVFLMALAATGLYRIQSRSGRDHTGPVITMDSDTVTVTTAATEEELLAGVTAQDSRDGDVSGTLLVESMSNFIEKGRRNVTIAAFDSDSNVTKTTREVIYSDYASPQFSLEVPLRFSVGSNNIFDGIRARDMLDGDVTDKIKTSADCYVDTMTPGEYPMVFTVSNSAGDVAELSVNVEIYEPEEEYGKPQFFLSQYLVYTTVGVPVNPWDYVQQISYGGTDFIRGEDGVLRDPYAAEGQPITFVAENEVEISQDVDYNTPGIYQITYRFSLDGSGTGSIPLIVVVE